MAPKKIRNAPLPGRGRVAAEGERPENTRRSRSSPPLTSSAHADDSHDAELRALQVDQVAPLVSPVQQALELQGKVSFTLHDAGGNVLVDIGLNEDGEDLLLAPILVQALEEPWHCVVTPGCKILGLSTSFSIRELAIAEATTELVCCRISIPVDQVADELLTTSVEVVPLVRRIFQKLDGLRDPRIVAWSLHKLTELTHESVCDAWLESLEALKRDRNDYPELGYLDPVRPFLQDLETTFHVCKCTSHRLQQVTVRSETGKKLKLEYTFRDLQAWRKACFTDKRKRLQVKSLLRAINAGLRGTESPTTVRHREEYEERERGQLVQLDMQQLQPLLIAQFQEPFQEMLQYAWHARHGQLQDQIREHLARMGFVFFNPF